MSYPGVEPCFRDGFNDRAERSRVECQLRAPPQTVGGWPLGNALANADPQNI